MLRDYQIVSPSLEGVLNDSLLSYEGLKRPVELLRILDGPSSKGKRIESDVVAEKPEENQKVLEQYFYDLYGIFMKKLSYLVVESDMSPECGVTLLAMLQELIKIKGMIVRRPVV